MPETKPHLKPAITQSALEGVPIIAIRLLAACVQQYLLNVDTLVVTPAPMFVRQGKSHFDALNEWLQDSDRKTAGETALFQAIYGIAPEIAKELRYINSVQLGPKAARAYRRERQAELCRLLDIDYHGERTMNEFDIIDEYPAVVILDSEETIQ